MSMTVGKFWNRLVKLWKRYKISGSTGEYRTRTAYDIVKLQAALNLPRSEFPELEGVINDYEFEDQETEPHPPEWSSLDETLRREEQEAEAEADDWWISEY